VQFAKFIDRSVTIFLFSTLPGNHHKIFLTITKQNASSENKFASLTTRADLQGFSMKLNINVRSAITLLGVGLAAGIFIAASVGGFVF
jgi:uncharacterized membrane protein